MQVYACVASYVLESSLHCKERFAYFKMLEFSTAMTIHIR